LLLPTWLIGVLSLSSFIGRGGVFTFYERNKKPETRRVRQRGSERDRKCVGVSIDVCVMCLTENQSHLMCVCACVCVCVFRCTSGLSNVLLAHTFQLPGNQSSLTPSSSYTSLLHFFIRVHVLLLPSLLHPRTPPSPRSPARARCPPAYFWCNKVRVCVLALGWMFRLVQPYTPSSTHPVAFMKKI
jgi:hypothetical protein